MIASLAGQIVDLQDAADERSNGAARLAPLERHGAAACDDPRCGVICATAFAASVTDPHQFRSGRQFAAWLGLTPLQHSQRRQGTARPDLEDGRPISAPASRRRHDLARPAREVQARRRRSAHCRPAIAQTGPRGHRRAAANRTARVVWAIMARGGIYRAPHRRRVAAYSSGDRRNQLYEVARTMRCDGEPVRPGTRTTRRMSRASQPAKQNGTSVRGYHQGQRSYVRPHQTGRTQDCTRPQRQNIKLTLAMREPSTQDIVNARATASFARTLSVQKMLLLHSLVQTAEIITLRAQS